MVSEEICKDDCVYHRNDDAQWVNCYNSTGYLLQLYIPQPKQKSLSAGR